MIHVHFFFIFAFLSFSISSRIFLVSVLCCPFVFFSAFSLQKFDMYSCKYALVFRILHITVMFVYKFHSHQPHINSPNCDTLSISQFLFSLLVFYIFQRFNSLTQMPKCVKKGNKRSTQSSAPVSHTSFVQFAFSSRVETIAICIWVNTIPIPKCTYL